jgi:hypothetical protein
MTNKLNKESSTMSRLTHWVGELTWILTPLVALVVWKVQPQYWPWYAMAVLTLVCWTGAYLAHQRVRNTQEHHRLLRNIGINQRLILESQRRLSERMVYLEFRISKKSS